MERVCVTKDDLNKAFDRLGDQMRFPFPGRFMVCKEVYKDDREIGDSNSAVKWECWAYKNEAMDALFNELKKVR